jgi:hypothetical protein
MGVLEQKAPYNPFKKYRPEWPVQTVTINHTPTVVTTHCRRLSVSRIFHFHFTVKVNHIHITLEETSPSPSSLRLTAIFFFFFFIRFYDFAFDPTWSGGPTMAEIRRRDACTAPEHLDSLLPVNSVPAWSAFIHIVSGSPTRHSRAPAKTPSAT